MMTTREIDAEIRSLSQCAGEIARMETRFRSARLPSVAEPLRDALDKLDEARERIGKLTAAKEVTNG